MTINLNSVRPSLPPLKYLDYRVDISIRIRQDGANYKAEINHEEMPIYVTTNELTHWSRQLRNKIASVVEIYHYREPSLREMTTGPDLTELAEFGHFVWGEIFGHNRSPESAMSILYDNWASERPVQIEIASEDFFLPWDLLYDRSLWLPIDIEGFWGARYVISRLALPPGPAHRKPRYILTDQPRVGLCADDTLEAVKSAEVPFFQELADKGALKLSVLHPLDPSFRVDALRDFRSFLADGLDLAHFACHAEVDEQAPELSYLRVSNEFIIKLQDIKNYDIQLGSNPLVIMNACETGNLSPLYTSSLVSALMKAGARSVVATECVVPDAFAAEFTAVLYRYLLRGRTIGEALLKTRRYFLTRARNPLGLIYALYGYPSVCLRSRSDAL